MLAYRHAFHAGNHADVLKHVVLIATLRYLQEKPTPIRVIDTHAGAGVYALDSKYASKLDEYRGGIGKLWDARDLPPAVADYVACVRAFNADGAIDPRNPPLARYPGSPSLVRALLRDGDQLRAFERHPTDAALLVEHFAHARGVKAEAGDGWAALRALLPPPSRRALVLIDPSYELPADYLQVHAVVQEGLQRFAQGVFVIWIPEVARREAGALVDKLKRLPAKDWLHARLTVCPPLDDGLGLTGSHVVVLNPPWTLHDQLRASLPVLVRQLAQWPGAGYGLERGSSAPRPRAER